MRAASVNSRRTSASSATTSTTSREASDAPAACVGPPRSNSPAHPATRPAVTNTMGAVITVPSTLPAHSAKQNRTLPRTRGSPSPRSSPLARPAATGQACVRPVMRSHVAEHARRRGAHAPCGTSAPHCDPQRPPRGSAHEHRRLALPHRTRRDPQLRGDGGGRRHRTPDGRRDLHAHREPRPGPDPRLLLPVVAPRAIA